LSNVSHLKYERVWAMPNKNTFKILPVAKLIEEEKIGDVIIEPFPYQAKIDCFDYLRQFENESADFALVDPPYTKRQVSEHYSEKGIKVTGWHTSSGWTAAVKKEVGRVLKIGAKSITFGYNTNGLGKINGFEPIRILDVCHGGDHYDLLCTVEIKTGVRK